MRARGAIGRSAEPQARNLELEPESALLLFYLRLYLCFHAALVRILTSLFFLFTAPLTEFINSLWQATAYYTTSFLLQKFSIFLYY